MPPSRRFVYEYHLRDHQQNLRLAFRAETAQRVLRLTMEDDRDEDGSSYPAFRRVNTTRDYSLAYQGRASAAVSASQPGPSTRLPVVGGDVVKVDFFYTTPAGPQHQRAAAPLPTASPAPRSLRLLPVLLPAPGSAGQPGGVDGHSGRAGGVGLQLQLGGLLSGRGRPRPASPVAPYENAETTGGPEPQPTMTRPAYLRWELRDAAGDVVQSDVVEVPTTEAGRDRWQHLSTAITVDKGPDGKLTGTLNVQLLNEGSQPVYVDSLTIRHPQPALVVSQENHYYPFGMNLSGVAVNTRPAEMISKRLYNGGSELEDDLLGAEGGNYSTPYRRYDATIGRFLGVDALAGKYASLSPYQFSFNDPVNFQDPSGADPGDGGMVFVHGRLANPRNVYGQRETDGGMGFLSRMQYDTFLQGWDVGGVSSMGRTVNDALQNTSLANGIAQLARAGIVGINYVKDNKGNLTNPVFWSTAPISVQSGISDQPSNEAGWEFLWGGEAKATLGAQAHIELGHAIGLQLNLVAAEIGKLSWDNKKGWKDSKRYHLNDYHVTQGISVEAGFGFSYEHSFDNIEGQKISYQHELKVNIFQLAGIFTFDGDWNNTDVFLGVELPVSVGLVLDGSARGYVGGHYKTPSK